jgi:hypothetical protein
MYYFNFPDDAPGLELPLDDPYPGYISTSGNIHDMPPGTGNTRGVVLWVTTEPNGKQLQWFLYFGSDCSLGDEPDRQFVVTKELTSEGDTVWTLGAPAEHKPILCRDRQPGEGGRGLITVGEIYMPFELTITLVPEEP